MKTAAHIFPLRVDRMPLREPSASPPHSVTYLIALALCMIPSSWSGKPLSEESYPVRAILRTLKWGGYKIVPMEREDFE